MLHDAGRVSQPTCHFAFRLSPHSSASGFPAGLLSGGVCQRPDGRWVLCGRAKGIMSLPAIAEPISSPQEETLETLMQRRLGNRIRDLRVVIRPEGVVLQGRTATYHAKQLAQHAAMELGKLPILANA